MSTYKDLALSALTRLRLPLCSPALLLDHFFDVFAQSLGVYQPVRDPHCASESEEGDLFSLAAISLRVLSTRARLTSLSRALASRST